MSGIRRIIAVLVLAATPLTVSGCLPACSSSGLPVNPYSCAG